MELREVVQVGFILFTTFDAVAPAEAKKKVLSESKGEASASKIPFKNLDSNTICIPNEAGV